MELRSTGPPAAQRKEVSRFLTLRYQNGSGRLFLDILLQAKEQVFLLFGQLDDPIELRDQTAFIRRHDVPYVQPVSVDVSSCRLCYPSLQFGPVFTGLPFSVLQAVRFGFQA